MRTEAQSIARHLPQVRGAAPGNYYPVSLSVYTTKNARSPKTIIAFPALEVQLNVVETEASHDLVTEGDVERVAAFYLVHDVNLIIEKGLFPRLDIPVNQFRCVGQSTSGRSRPDIKFVVQGTTVLILEYKTANTPRDSDWTSGALVTQQRSAQQIINNTEEGARTVLVDNAGVLLLQASKHSLECGVVVLCDYQSMIVLDLTTGPGNAPWDDLTCPIQYLFSSADVLTHTSS